MTRQEAVSIWIKENTGKWFNIDNAGNGLDCIDVPKKLTTDITGVGWLTAFGYGNARDLFAKANPDIFDKFVNTPDGVPVPGDIIFWNAGPYATWGHVAVVTEANISSFKVLEADSFVDQPTWIGAYKSYAYVQGWVRLKDKYFVNTMTLRPGEFMLNSNVNYRKTPSRTGELIKTFSAGDTVFLKGRVQGQDVQGQNWWLVGALTGGYMIASAVDGDWTALPDVTSVLITPPTVVTPPAVVTPPVVAVNSLKGIDISKFQADNLSFDGWDFVIVKAGHTGVSYGGLANNQDPKHKVFVDRARAEGKLVGHYWYLYPTLGITSQADDFIATINRVGNLEGEPLFLDTEESGITTADILAFRVYVENMLGKKVYLYTYENFAATRGITDVDWYANYSAPAGTYNRASFIHQYSSSDNLDKNVAKITRDEWKLLGRVKQIVVNPPAVPTPPVVVTPPTTPTPTPTTTETPALTSAGNLIARLTTQAIATKAFCMGLMSILETQFSVTMPTATSNWICAAIFLALAGYSQWRFKVSGGAKGWFV